MPQRQIDEPIRVKHVTAEYRVHCEKGYSEIPDEKRRQNVVCVRDQTGNPPAPEMSDAELETLRVRASWRPLGDWNDQARVRPPSVFGSEWQLPRWTTSPVEQRQYQRALRRLFARGSVVTKPVENRRVGSAKGTEQAFPETERTRVAKLSNPDVGGDPLL